MKTKSFFFIGIAVLVLSIALGGCDFGGSGDKQALSWNVVHNISGEFGDITEIDLDLIDEDDDDDGSGGDISRVAYGNGTIVVANRINGKVAYSTNKGTTWAFADSKLNDGIHSIAYANGVFAAYGSAYALVQDEYTNEWNEEWIRTSSWSSDCVNWHLTDLRIGITGVRGIFSRGETFFISSNKLYSLRYSFDGANWDYSDMPFSSARPTASMAYSGTKHVVVGTGGSKRNITACYSIDGGITWVATMEESLLKYAVNGIAYGDGVFIAGGSDYRESDALWIDDGIDANMIISSDAINWTRGNVNLDYVDELAFGDGTFIAIGDGVSYSTDKGQTWEKGSIDTNVSWFSNLIYGNGYFVALGYINQGNYTYTGKIYHSLDNGKTWQSSTLNSSINEIINIDGGFIAVGDDGLIYRAMVK